VNTAEFYGNSLKKIDGRDIIQFIHEEISTPLGLANLRFGLDGRDMHQFAYSYWLGADKMVVAGNDIAPNFEKMLNNKASFMSPSPAFNIVTDAASLAGFYEFLINQGMTYDGKKF